MYAIFAADKSSPMKPRVVAIPAKDLAQSLKATVHGPDDLVLTGLCPLNAPLVGHLTFIKGRSPATTWRTLIKLPALAVLVEPTLLPDGEALRSLKCTLLVVSNAHGAFLDAIRFFYEPEVVPALIHPSAVIDPSAEIADGVAIGPFCCIGARVRIEQGATIHNSVNLARDVVIGARTVIHSGVTIREGCTLGSDCTVHNNTVIGADGFGYVPDANMGIRKVPQVGTVQIGDHVEVGACTSIDRAAVGVTRIGSFTKIDNQVQIGHNVTIGSHCLICAQVGIAGSALIGDQVVLGGGTGVADHVTVVSQVRVGGHCGVTSDILEAGDYLGMPAVKAQTYRRQVAALKRLSQR
jgi:UDP-3-O-[3-hydroxymyristoyl] glucosamine N-acyltransferase